MNDDKKKNNNKIQYETKVQVEKIIDIKIIWSNKDSMLKSSISSSIPIAYIFFYKKMDAKKHDDFIYEQKYSEKIN